ncbi:MAG: metallophosphoesterase family protein [Bacillota bacterium]|jgi:putative phosphoesterase
MKVGVLSDTHLPRRGKVLSVELWEAFGQVDLILHAGDIIDEAILSDLKALAPVEAVAGNMDFGHLAFSRLPRKKLLSLENKKIGLIHGDGLKGTTLERARKAFEEDSPDCIVFGHSHQPYNKIVHGILMFNPGSCIDPRREPYPSYGILHIGDNIKGEIHYFK